MNTRLQLIRVASEMLLSDTPISKIRGFARSNYCYLDESEIEEILAFIVQASLRDGR